MKIVAIKYGESVFGESNIYKGGNKDRVLPISFVIYLIQIEGKNILVDAGFDDCAGFEMSIFKESYKILEEYGVKTDDITDVILTHCHHDHVEAVWRYNKAKIHIQKDEYDLTKNYIPKDFNVNIFENEYALTERVRVKKIGGHSKGSSIVLADNYVLCGDECYMRNCLTDNIMTGSSYCEEKSQEFLNKYSDEKYKPLLFHDPEIMKGKIGYMVIKL